MSRAGSSPYIESAAYYTDPRLAYAILTQLAADGVLREGMRVGEWHVGGGSWLLALERLRRERGWRPFALVAADIRPDAKGLQIAEALGAVCLVGDFLTLDAPPVDLSVGNPPFSDTSNGTRGEHVAERHVSRALEVGEAVGYLVRIGIFSAGCRRAWVKANIPHLQYHLCPRPGFDAEVVRQPIRQQSLLGAVPEPETAAAGKAGKDVAEYIAGLWKRETPPSGRTLSSCLWWDEVGAGTPLALPEGAGESRSLPESPGAAP